MADNRELHLDLDGTPVWDSLDIDLFVKVLSHTALSPFFVFLIPVFYIFQGAKYNDPIIIVSSLYYVAVCVFWFVKWLDVLYRNQGSFMFAPKRFDWGEQIVVITGGASGTGELLANTLAVRNVTVVVLDVKPIATENYNITYYKCDVSKWEEVEAVSKKLIEEIGQPTVLVNNAGVVQGKRILDLSEKDVQQTFAVNTLSHFWTLKAFLPGMIEAGSGHIVNVSSVMGITGVAQMTDYCASKSALISLNESLRYELDNLYKVPGIRTTLICSGHTLTPLFSKVSLQESFIRKFFIPSIPSITIVKKIIAALDNQHSETLYLPFYVNFAPYLQHLPSFIKDNIHKFIDADHSMAHFEKVTGLREDEIKKE